MAILNIQVNEPGQAGIVPRIVRIETDDSVATVTTAGYLTDAVKKGLATFNESDMCCVVTQESASSAQEAGWYEVSNSNGVWSLVPPASPGDVVLPTVANRLAHFSNTTGTLSGAAADVTNLGDLTLGASGTEGILNLYPATAANGTLIVKPVDAGADFDTTISNAASVGQDQVITIPDSGAATANFLLDSGSANILSHQEFIGIESVLTFGTGTWTVTRIAQGNYVSRHTVADETSIIAIDITPQIRTAASKGFRLDSFDVIYAIAADALDAHSVVLDRIEYADNAAVSVNSIAITGTLATATQANPYVTNVAVDSPAFDNTADSKYVIELTVNNSASSEYDYYGIMLRFSETVA